MAEHLTAPDMFLFLEGVNGGPIPGETTDAAHPNEVQIQSFEVHVSGDSSDGQEGAWKANFQPISITIITGRASPFLFRAACAGTIFKRVTISCRKPGAGKGAGDYLQWRFHDVQVVDYTMKIEEGKPSETILITYQVVELYYARQDQKGALIDPVKRSWSLDENKEAPITLPYVPKGSSSGSSTSSN